ncbi:acyltransferase family protein [Bradyrhizobium sp. PMVTL-01]|uniref:acyltransferase family protein n=1 Tax=unclassified Bradyrhizobium TaxID=2631580 RepID=UPI003F701315
MEPNSRLPGIQAGRAIAAVSVFYFHSYIALSNFNPQHLLTFDWLARHGASGVDLFFAISGFIVCHVASASDFETGEFLWKRFFRIYPLNALVTLFIVVFVVSGIRISDDADPLHIIKSLLIFPQFAPINSVGWTLEYEVAFYMIAALILPRGGPAALLAYCATSFVLWNVLDPHNAIVSRFITEKHAAFGAGVAAYMVAIRLPKSRVINDLYTSSFLLAFAFGVFISGHHWLPARIPTPLACGIAVAGLAIMPIVPKLFVKFGDVSYGFYLIHWPIVCLSPWLTGNDNLNLHRDLGEVWRWTAFAIIWTLAALSWRYVETPINRWSRGRSDGRMKDVAKIA